MEYRHKFMRGTVESIIHKAICDIRNDPRRGIRNLADFCELFSTSTVQKKFIALVRSVLKNPCNPYNDLVVKMIRSVKTDTLSTLSLNFGYTALSYGAKILRKRQTELGCHIPWLLVFRFGSSEEENGGRISGMIAEAASLGIFSFVFQPQCQKDLEVVEKLCEAYPECLFFIAASPELLVRYPSDQLLRISNAVFPVDATGAPQWDAAQWDTAEQVFQRLRESECFFGYYAYYTDSTVSDLTAPGFTRRLMQSGCLVGAYVNQNRDSKSLEERVYRYVCLQRGRNGKPLFVMDFYRDISYVGKSISGGDYLLIQDSDLSDPDSPSLAERIQRLETVGGN